MSEIAFRPASELVAALRRREIGSRELLDHYLARVATLNPAINAVVTLDADNARKRADAADAAAVRGDFWGPLHGLPMTVKDTFETAGVRTTAGAPELSQHVPSGDAVAVTRLKAAGAVIFGKTNTPLYAGDTQTYNAVFGTTNNPWDVKRSTGGSSGGSAAALAAGLTGFELGSDIGGSIRNPSHFCGVYGHKPTFGTVPVRGHIPGPPGQRAIPDMGVVGPLGRSPEDLSLGLDVLAGAIETEEGVAWRLSLPPPRHASLREYRVAVWLDDPEVALAANALALLENAVAAVRGAGAKVDVGARPGISLTQAFRDYRRLLVPVISQGFPKPVLEGFDAMAQQLAPDDDSELATFARWSRQRHHDWLEVNEARAGYRARWAELFRRYDVLLCPVTAGPAIPHDHSEPLVQRQVEVDGKTQSYLSAMLAWNGSIGNLCYLPATVAPVGRTAEGLPVGIQIVGPFLEDRTCIGFAVHLRDVLGGFQAPPGF
ncbi:MAG: amidase [Deltaproteobacteria bacterium]|nr:amidase [Deltaproteobacteria bacterium]